MQSEYYHSRSQKDGWFAKILHFTNPIQNGNSLNKISYNLISLNPALSFQPSSPDLKSGQQGRLRMLRGEVKRRGYRNYSKRDCNKQLIWKQVERMSRKVQNYSKNCFRIRGRQDLYIKEQVLVSFAPLRKTKLIKRTSILPTFNHDHKFQTLAFSLPSTEPDPEDTLREDHEKRVKEAEAELEELWCPKPRSRHKYCGVCRGYYEDYKQHTQGEKHRENLKNSPYQHMIGQMAQHIQQLLQLARQEEPGVNQSFSEDQIFKCLSTQTLQEGTSERKGENYLIQG